MHAVDDVSERKALQRAAAEWYQNPPTLASLGNQAPLTIGDRLTPGTSSTGGLDDL
jgi:hypothetical protein